MQSIFRPLGTIACRFLPSRLISGVALATLLVPSLAPIAESAEMGGAPAVATVNGEAVSLADFQAAFARNVRQKFYHGGAPEGATKSEMQATLRAMLEELLLAQEIERRKLTPDTEKVAGEIAAYERQYGSSPQWQQSKDSLLPGLRAELERRNLVAQLEATVRALPQPSDKEVRAFYREKSELFTEPERVRVSSILLPVDPSSPTTMWQAAYEEAKRLRFQIVEGGQDFAGLARKHSSHPSAERGGDMGYVHRGMLGEDATSAIDKLNVGEVSEPLRTLEGILIVRLSERQPAALRAYSEVKERAAELLLRNRRDDAWKRFRERLYESAAVTVRSDLVPELADFPLPKAKKSAGR